MAPVPIIFADESGYVTVERVDIAVPAGDREVLIAPPAKDLAALVRANAEVVAGYDFTFAGRPFTNLRETVRREVMSAASAYTASLGVLAPKWDGGPVVMTGHQPEFYHPGVWVKNHLAARLAQAAGGTGLNLVVDNDVPREGELLFPVRAPGGFTRHGVHFAEIDPARAWEEHTDKGSWRFDRVAGEVTELLPLADDGPLIGRFLSGAADCMTEARDLAHLMTLLRRRYEERVGLSNLEIPASTMSDTSGFALFVLGLAARAGRFADAYNDAVREYRRVNGIRSSSHPAPDLGVERGRVELPFWVWAPGGRRRRLWLEAERGATFLMDDEVFWTLNERTWRGILKEDAGAFDEAARRMLAEGRGHFRIRPRALSNTVFCRVFLSDVFIHGVGGAKYDGITDEIVREFFGVEPPGFITCSATLFLPIDVEASRRDDLRRLTRELRDARFNPERHMDDETRQSVRVENLVGEKRRLIERNKELREQGGSDGDQQARRERREIFTDIRRRNAQLATLIEDRIDSLAREIDRVSHHVGDREVVQQRDYSFVLYPERQLVDFYAEKLDLT